MTLSKTSVQPIDLDDLERQLREVAVSSLPKKDDPLAELARIVGREAPLRAVTGGRGQSPASQPAAGSVTELGSAANPAGLDLESSIKEAVRADQARAGVVARAPAGAAQEAAADFVEDELVNEEAGYEEEAAAEDDSSSYTEEWEEPAYQEDGADYEGGDAARFAGVEHVPGMPQRGEGGEAPARRGFLSPRALALAVPLVLVCVGAGAAFVVKGGTIRHSAGGEAPVIAADSAPVKVQPDKAASGDQTPSQTALGAADASGKPSQISVVRPEQPVDVVAAAKAAQPRDGAIVQPPPSSGIVILSGPSSSSSPSAPTALPGAIAAAPASAAAPAQGAAAPAMSTTAANVPLPDPPAPAGQGSVFGTPRRVSTVSVKPDGTIVGNNAKPKAETRTEAKTETAAPKPMMVASADTTAAPAVTGSVTPAPKKVSDTPRAKPKPKVADGANQGADSSAPLSITPQGRGHSVVASAAPVQASATPAPEAAAASSGGAFSIQLASSPSEGDARATLSRLQRQFPGLGAGAVHRADLGSKGIFYRVRVGPLSREAADKMCAQLKAGGADCILTRG